MLCKLSLTFLLVHSILYQRMILKNTNKTKATVRKYWSYVVTQLTAVACEFLRSVLQIHVMKLFFSL